MNIWQLKPQTATFLTKIDDTQQSENENSAVIYVLSYHLILLGFPNARV